MLLLEKEEVTELEVEVDEVEEDQGQKALLKLRKKKLQFNQPQLIDDLLLIIITLIFFISAF
jgi:hypothetical protein